MEARIACALFVVGLLVPYWPLSVCGVVLYVISGHWRMGVASALLLDVVYATPTGFAQHLPLPCTLGALLLMVVRMFIFPYVRPRPGMTI